MDEMRFNLLLKELKRMNSSLNKIAEDLEKN